MTPLGGGPMPVEFCYGGAWWSGVLLGWRHEPDGTCRVRVQTVIGGLRRSSWMQLTDVRLPEPVPLSWSAEPPRPSEPSTRPDLLLPDRDRSRPLLPTPPQPQPGRSGDDLSRV
jgi:hypothetical protein